MLECLAAGLNDLWLRVLPQKRGTSVQDVCQAFVRPFQAEKL